MRKVMFVLLVLSALCAVRSEAGAVSVSVGGAAWYADWYFKEDRDKEKKVDPAFVYGPLFSIGSGNWSWSNLMLYGKFKMHQGENDGGDITLTRYDIDSAVNYSVTDWFKLFGGCKLMRYSFPGFKHQAAGPAAGIGLTIPLIKNFYLLGTASGIYMFGHQDNTTNTEGRDSGGFRSHGANSTLALAYSADSLPVTISLSGRCQYFRALYNDQKTNVDTTHMFYGVMLSAIYTFR